MDDDSFDSKGDMTSCAHLDDLISIRETQVNDRLMNAKEANADDKECPWGKAKSAFVCRSQREVGPRRIRRYRKRAELPPDVLAKVRERDKKRKRVTRLKMRGEWSDCNAFNASQGWPTGSDDIPDIQGSRTEKMTDINEESPIDPLPHDWDDPETDIRRQAMINMHDFLIGQTLNAEERVKRGDKRARDKGDLSGCGIVTGYGSKLGGDEIDRQGISSGLWNGREIESEDGIEMDVKSKEMMIRMSPQMMAHTESMRDATQGEEVPSDNGSEGSSRRFSRTLRSSEGGGKANRMKLKREIIEDRREIVNGTAAQIPFVLKKAPGYEIINVAVNGGGADTEQDPLEETGEDCSVEGCEDNGAPGSSSSYMNGEVDEGRLAPMEDKRFERIKEERNEDMNMDKDEPRSPKLKDRKIQRMKTDEDRTVKPSGRKARSRRVLPPEKLAYVRAVDAERKKIARTRLKLLELTKSAPSERNTPASKRLRQSMKRRKWKMTIEDRAKLSARRITNDEHKENRILEKRLDKYKELVQKMLASERANSDGSLPLEVLRVMVVEQAKLFAFLAQRKDMRDYLMELGPSQATNHLSSNGVDSASDTFHQSTSVNDESKRDETIEEQNKSHSEVRKQKLDGSKPTCSKVSDGRRDLNPREVKIEVIEKVSRGRKDSGAGSSVRSRRGTWQSKRRDQDMVGNQKGHKEDNSDEKIPEASSLHQQSTKVALKVKRIRKTNRVRRALLSKEDLALERSIDAARKRVWRAKRRADKTEVQEDADGG